MRAGAYGPHLYGEITFHNWWEPCGPRPPIRGLTHAEANMIKQNLALSIDKKSWQKDLTWNLSTMFKKIHNDFTNDGSLIPMKVVKRMILSRFEVKTIKWENSGATTIIWERNEEFLSINSCSFTIRWDNIRWVLMSAHECSRVLTVPLHNAQECVWLTMTAYEHWRVLISAHECF